MFYSIQWKGGPDTHTKVSRHKGLTKLNRNYTHTRNKHTSYTAGQLLFCLRKQHLWFADFLQILRHELQIPAVVGQLPCS